MNQTNQNTDTRISHDMNLDNQIPTIQPINNTTLEDMNTNTNTANYDTWFAFDHAKSLHTGNLFHSGILKENNPQTRFTTANKPNPNTESQPPNINTTTTQTSQHIPTPNPNTNTQNQTNTYRSYANVTSYASRRSKAKLQYFPPTNIEDNQSPVIIPIQLCEQANEKHANILFGYFIGANPSFTTVRDHVKSKWAPCGITDIKRNGKGFYLFKFSTEQAWSVEGIGRIASRIGIPLDMDTYTKEMCVEGKGRCAYARVLIQIAATKPWEEFMEVQTWDLNTKTGVNHLVHLEYSWVPTRCDKCKIYDHSKSTCPLQVNEKAPTSNTNTTANHPTPIFGANADKEGFTLVTKRKRNINSTRGRSRGPHKTTSPNHIPKPNPQQANNQQKDDFRFIATKSTSSIEKNKSTIINQESNTQTDASTSDFKVVNNNTLVEDIQAETTMEDEKTDEVDLNSNMDEDILKHNQFATLVTNEEEVENEATTKESSANAQITDNQNKVTHEVAMEDATKTNTVSR
ncbi:hypothetical protein LXL04_033564 [Taraxacum kok-saghyz]